MFRRPTGSAGPRPLLGLAVALLLTSSGAAAVTVASEQAAFAATSNLSVSPTNYVGGQRLTWRGNLGVRGERALTLQFNMGTATGGHWTTVDGFGARTRADGSFSFAYPAPSMFNIRYRVKAGRYASPARVFNAKTQDLTIRVTGRPETNTNQPARVDPGKSFGITVDTTPDNIHRSPESHGLPVFRGRVLTLQERVDGDTWQTLDTTTVAADGTGHFTGLRERAGTVVYRVRQENYFSNGNKIGWSQSFPLYVLVGQDAHSRYARLHGSDPASEAPPRRGSLGRQPTTASQRYSWFPSLFDFAWEHGQSLSSPPARGTRIRGDWEDFSTGSGRVSKYNGGLALDSKRYTGAGPGDFGTTRATLRGNAMTYGRWETSLRVRNAFERGGRAYRMKAELVPAGGSQGTCLARSITIARISPFTQRVHFGVKSPDHRWRGTARAPYTPLANAYNVAVEVAEGHITWFLNSSPVGSVTSEAAIPGVPLTLRLSLVGDGSKEMNQVGLISDWQRGFPVTTGKRTVTGQALPRDARNAHC